MNPRRGRRALLLVLGTLAVLPATAAAAAGDSVSADRVRDLSRRAAADPAALAELRQVRRVDGRRVDLGRALGDARGPELRARLRALGDTAPRDALAPAPARERARGILRERRFRATPLPRPLRGVFRPIGRVLADGFRWLADRLPGGDAAVWALLALAVLGTSVLLTLRTLRRRSSGGHGAAQPATARARADDPERLEHEAEEAERAGDLRRALRLRFRAGLLRLDAARVIAFRPSISTVDVARRVRSEEFAALARTFDEVVYGGRPAAQDDVAEARERWPRVIAGAIS